MTVAGLATSEVQRRRGGGWGVDYPRADTNLSIRLSELTKTKVSFNADRLLGGQRG